MKDKTLETHIRNGTVAQSYLLIDRDVLKLKEIAKWFSTTPSPSGATPSQAKGNLFNVADIFHLEGTPNIKVAETEEFIAKAYLAAVGDKKLFIICDASTMTIAAQNKTLKTIEDTPANTTFMLLASSATTILNTIKSRCVTIYPDPLPQSHDETHPIYVSAKKLLSTTSLDEALPLLPLLTKKENLSITFLALDHYAKDLPIPKRNAVHKTLAQINRNISAGCNPTNAFDMLLIKYYFGMGGN